jgi:outer membrane protein OmpA-like peptidoglycan-associated protein
MRHIIAVSVGALALTSALCTTARAQENEYLQEREKAPSDALELKATSGYTQGFGGVAPGRGVDRVAGAGIGVGGDVDYRIDREWSVGAEGQYQEFVAADNTSARGTNANIGATYHFNPVFRGDPWARLGTGYRWLWENGPGGAQGVNTMRHGFEPLAAKVGYDVRVSPDVALAPVVGADLNVFAWEVNSSSTWSTMSTPQVATFVYAGLQGRFDIGGTRSDGRVVAQRAPVGVTAPQPQAPVAPAPVEETQPVSPNIAVSEDIMRECALHLEKAPKFEFDKSDLQAEDMAVLSKIGECFTTGPMKDSTMRLVGRADPRGSLEYNDALGMRRASEVSGFLERAGVEAGRIDKISRGKRDAVGTDEASWAVDRRVDVLQGH